jgi:hypothetical protein
MEEQKKEKKGYLYTNGAMQVNQHTSGDWGKYNFTANRGEKKRLERKITYWHLRVSGNSAALVQNILVNTIDIQQAFSRGSMIEKTIRNEGNKHVLRMGGEGTYSGFASGDGRYSRG